MNEGHLTPEQQARLRETGLLADAHEPYMTPDGVRLDAMPTTFEAKRRQRGDRLTNADAERLGLTKKRSGAR